MAEDKNFNLYYGWDVEFFIDGEDISIRPSQIKLVTQTGGYLSSDDFVPKLKMVLSFNVTEVDIIKKKEKLLQANITCTLKKFLDGDNGLEEVETEIIFENVFTPFFNPRSLENIARIKSKEEVENDQDANGMSSNYADGMNSDVMVSFYTLVSRVVSKRIITAVLRSSSNGPIDVGSALLYIGDKSGIPFMIDPPANTYKYSNIIIPSGSIRYSVEWLQRMYGIYMDDYLFFIDLDNKLYILSKYVNKHEYEAGDFPVSEIILSTATDTPSSDMALVKYDKNSVVYDSVGGIVEADKSVVSGETDGDQMIFTNFGLGMKTIEYSGNTIDSVNQPIESYKRSTDSHSATGQKIAFEYDELNNSFNMFSFLKGQGLSKVVIITIKGLDMRSLKPNKLFKLTFPDSVDLEAKYINETMPIVNYETTFKPISSDPTSDQFQCVTNLGLLIL